MATNISSNNVVKSGVFTARFFSVSILTVVLFSLLVKLGFWQLGRAEEKRMIEKQVAVSSQLHIKPLNEITDSDLDAPTGIRVEFEGQAIEGRYLVLDNQRYQGKVGYLAMQLTQNKTGEWVLIERGFIAAPTSRDELPSVDWLSGEVKGKGRLYRRSTNPLSKDLYMEEGTPSRIQNLNFEQLETHWQVELQRYVVQPQLADWPYPQPWQPISMSPDKHVGYAVQWFSMAAVLVLLCCGLIYRMLRLKAY